MDKYISGWQDCFTLDTFISWCGKHNVGYKKYVRERVIDSKYDSILDVGAGVCTEYYGFKSDGYKIDYTATEITPKFVQYGTERGINIVEAGLEVLPFANEKFDCTICVDVLNHQRCYKEAIKEMLRVSRNEVIIALHKKFQEDVIGGRDISGNYKLHTSKIGLIEDRVLDQSGSVVCINHFFNKGKFIDFLSTIEGIEFSIEKGVDVKKHDPRNGTFESRNFIYIKKKS